MKYYVGHIKMLSYSKCIPEVLYLLTQIQIYVTSSFFIFSINIRLYSMCASFKPEKLLLIHFTCILFAKFSSKLPVAKHPSTKSAFQNSDVGSLSQLW